MVHGAIQQFLKDFDWGDLDYLVVDLPPGTGDASLSLSQLIPLSGVVIVTTPQDVALQDVAKGMAMFKQLEVPIIGVIENMSYFVCPNCSEKHEIFGHGGGERIAKTFGVPFLGQIPLQMNVRTGGDDGQPVVMADPESPAAKALELRGRRSGAPGQRAGLPGARQLRAARRADHPQNISCAGTLVPARPERPARVRDRAIAFRRPQAEQLGAAGSGHNDRQGPQPAA